MLSALIATVPKPAVLTATKVRVSLLASVSFVITSLVTNAVSSSTVITSSTATGA